MLQLMPLLEDHGKKFADKSLISISGACLGLILKKAGYVVMCHLFHNITGNHTVGVKNIQMLKTKLSSSRQMQRPAC